MSKTIAVWGSPNSGKTTLSVKLAKYINEKFGATVAVICTDDITPALPTIFPTHKRDEFFSISTLLTLPDITKENVLSAIVTSKKNKNVGVLGLIDGENKYSYPTPSKPKIEKIIGMVKASVDVVIIDCSSNLDNLFTEVALGMSDVIIRTVTPTLKCISFFSSQLPLMVDPKYNLDKHINVMNITNGNIVKPTSEAMDYFKQTIATFPFAKDIIEQTTQGLLLSNVKSTKWNSSLKFLAEMVVK